MSSAQRKKDILEKVESKAGSVFKVKPSEITQKDINYMVNVINKRLYNLEKKGFTESSREYRTIEEYATAGSPFYNVDLKKGTIRVKSSLKSFKGRDKEKFINTLRNIMLAKTSTVAGTKKTQKASYETFIKKYNFDKSSLTEKKYKDIWNIYKDKISQDKKDKFGSDKVISMIEYGSFAELTPDEMENALDYMANYEYDLDAYEDWLNQHQQSN